MQGQWDSKKLRLVIAGKDMTPSGQDNYVKIERLTADEISSQSGINGESNISEIYDYRHKATLVYLGSDPKNAILDTLTKTRIAFPFLIEDKSDGGELGFALKCRVMTRPSMERGKEYKEKTWVILLPDYNGVTLA
jgi:hypothetical protein